MDPRSAFAVALTCLSAQVALAQDTRGLRLDSRLRAPAAFKTSHCVAKVVVERGRSVTLPTSSDTIAVLIDKTHSLSLRALPKAQRDTYTVTFAPPDSLCDGRNHEVQLSWKGTRPMTHHVVFPGAW